MKKSLKIILGVVAFFIIASLFIENPDEKKDEVQSADEPVAVENIEEENVEEDEVLINPYEDRKAEIFDIALKRIKENDYSLCTINEIKINDNLGTEVNDDYVLLVYGTFDVKNDIETGNGVMRMFADDLVAYMSKEGVDDVIEAAVFWEDDYNNRNLKYAYEYRNGAFYITDVMGENK